MTAERALRVALEKMPHSPGCNRTWIGAKPGLGFGVCNCGRDAALALPPSETREEWRVAYEQKDYCGEWHPLDSGAFSLGDAIEVQAYVAGTSSLRRIDLNQRLQNRRVLPNKTSGDRLRLFRAFRFHGKRPVHPTGRYGAGAEELHLPD